ncbi:hypothetical protein RBG11_004223 [Vibrio parahaemolyticus]|nr:hypothetical protein [Vibrio parahaemolyticus]
MNSSVESSMAYAGLPPRLAPYSTVRHVAMMSTLALARHYVKLNPDTKAIPSYIFESSIASDFKPNKKVMFAECTKSQTYAKLIGKYKNPKLTTNERMLDYTGIRRHLFLQVLKGELAPQNSLEYCVISKFLKMNTEIKDLTVYAAELYNNGIKLEKNIFFSSYENKINEHLFSFSRVFTGFLDYEGFLVDIANDVYNQVIAYVNGRDFEYADALNVMDVLFCVMTLSGTCTPIKAFYGTLNDMEKAKKFRRMTSYYYLPMMPLEDIDNKDRVIGLSELFDLSDNAAEVRNLFNLMHKKEGAQIVRSDQVRRILAHTMDIQSKEFMDQGNLNLGLNSTPIFIVDTMRKAVPLMWLAAVSRLSMLMQYAASPESSFDLVTTVQLQKIFSKMYLRLLTIQSKFVMPYEIMVATLKLMIQTTGKPLPKNGGYDKEAISQFIHENKGIVAEKVNEVIERNVILFSGGLDLGVNDIVEMTDALVSAYSALDDIQGEDENPDTLFAMMNEMRNSENFDAEAFSRLATEFAKNKSNSGDIASAKRLIFDEYLEVFERLGKEKLEDAMAMFVTRPTDPEVLAKSVKTDEINFTEGEGGDTAPQEAVQEEFDPVKHVTQEEYEEALQMMHEAEVERDEAKRKMREAEVEREQAKKHAYSLERPAACGEALVRYAKKGYIDSVEHALGVAEALAEGRLRVLPSAVESAKDSRYNVPDKVKAALCMLADRYIEDLEKGGIPLARKQHGRAFRGGESESVCSSEKLSEQRMFEVDGEKRMFTTHLAFGTKASKNNHVRIYFDVDLENRQIIIAYCGKHLDTTASV